MHAGYVHRDVRWCNVIFVPPEEADVQAGPTAAAGGGTWVLIDLEHAGYANCICRGDAFPLAPWEGRSPLEHNACYSVYSDMYMVASQLLQDGDLPFALSDDGRGLRDALLRRELTAAEALQHAWLMAA